eukprot:7781992-Pyramimonas_sp.AAC.3
MCRVPPGLFGCLSGASLGPLEAPLGFRFGARGRRRPKGRVVGLYNAPPKPPFLPPPAPCPRAPACAAPKVATSSATPARPAAATWKGRGPPLAAAR